LNLKLLWGGHNHFKVVTHQDISWRSTGNVEEPKKEIADLQLAKDCEALIERGLEDLAKRRWKEQEKMRLLREVRRIVQTEWPKKKRLSLVKCVRTPDTKTAC
jgi:hypothetical protein